MNHTLRISIAAALFSLAAAGTALAGLPAGSSPDSTAVLADSLPPLQTGWVAENGQWKYYQEDGTMARSAWIQDGEGSWYFLNDDGSMRTGWLQNGDDWYFFDSSGVMQTRAIRVEDRVYYMNYDGTLLVGSHSVDGIRYKFTENGCIGQMPYTSKMFHADGTPFTEEEKQNLSWHSPG